MKIRTLALFATTTLLAACGDTSGPEKVWETAGFKNPESAFADTEAGVIYVSNVNGSPGDRDGNGYISKVGLDGKIVTEQWITGLDAPKGLAMSAGKLFVGDLDKLVEIDVKTGAVVKHEAPGAKILNGVAADGAGNVYASDWPGNAIWRFSNGTFEKWLEGNDLKNPNGLLVDGDKLIVAAWGLMEPDFSTKTPGNLLSINLADKSISNLGKPVGNLDGIKPFDADSYIVSDWVAGKVFQIDKAGDAKEILVLSQGSADLAFIAASRTAIIPLMVDGKVVAYKF